MSQFFISYSRKDLDIAEKIINALAKDDLEPWIDWKSIPKGEKFEEEIYLGIEESEIFLFLLSPDSAQSGWCNKEIGHAVKNGKRILPIVIRDTNLKSIHPEISNRNWIFCRDGQDDFDGAIGEIHKNIYMNHEWLRFHTKLQIKAHEWVSNKDNSRLLRGRELLEAQRQLLLNGSLTNPEPTALQHQYVFVSHNHEKQLRRTRIIWASLVVSIVLVLTFFAKLQWEEASNQRATAVAESVGRTEAEQMSLARKLAERSQEIGSLDSWIFVGNETPMGNTQVISTLLAIESIKRNPTSEGIQALVNQLDQFPLIVSRQSFLTDGAIDVLETAESVEFSRIYLNPDQSQAFKIARTTDTNYILYNWTIPDLQEINAREIKVAEETGLSQPPLVMTRDTDWVAFISENGIVLQKTITDATYVIWEISERFSSLKFNQSSNLLLASTQVGEIKVWDVKTQNEILTLFLDEGVENAFFAGPGTVVIQTIPDSNGVQDTVAYDIQTGALITRFPKSNYLGSNDTGMILAYSFEEGSDSDNIHVWDMDLRNEVMVLDKECLIDFIPGTEYILTVTRGDSGSCFSGLGNPIHIYDIRQRQKKFELEMNGSLWARKINVQANMMAISTGETIFIIDLIDFKVTSQFSVGFTADAFEFSPDNSVLIIANKSPLPIVEAGHSFDAIVWDLENDSVLGKIPHDNYVSSITFLEDKKNIIIANSNGTLITWNIEQFWKRSKFDFQHDFPAPFPGSVASGWTFAVPVFNPNGNQFAVGGGNGYLETFDDGSASPSFSFTPTDSTLSYELAYSPNGNWLAFTGLFCQQGDCPNNVKVLDIENNSIFIIDSMAPTSLANFAFSPDSQYIAIAWTGTQNLLRIWDISQRQLVKEILINTQDWDAMEAVFSPQGGFLVLTSAGENGFLKIYDTSSWSEMFAVDQSTGPIVFQGENTLIATNYNFSTNFTTINTYNLLSKQKRSFFAYNGKIIALKLSTDENILTAINADETLVAWDVHTGTLVSEKLVSNLGKILLASPGYPSWFIVTSGSQVNIIDVQRKVEIERIETGEPIYALDINTDGKTLITGGVDGKVQVWIWYPGDLIIEACRRLPRNLTQSEWDEYLGDEKYKPTCPNLPIPNR
jgi:WD40 repeat protein